MSRYIDADELRKNEIARCHCVPCVGNNDNNYKDLDEVLNDAPTADVVEVRHGEWLHPLTDEPWKPETFGKCSRCGYICKHIKKMYMFCEQCGAKMDGER